MALAALAVGSLLPAERRERAGARCLDPAPRGDARRAHGAALRRLPRDQELGELRRGRRHRRAVATGALGPPRAPLLSASPGRAVDRVHGRGGGAGAAGAGPGPRRGRPVVGASGLTPRARRSAPAPRRRWRCCAARTRACSPARWLLGVDTRCCGRVRGGRRRRPARVSRWATSSGRPGGILPRRAASAGSTAAWRRAGRLRRTGSAKYLVAVSSHLGLDHHRDPASRW